MQIPESGLATNDILSTLKSYKHNDLDWSSGRVFGYIYDPGKEATEAIHQAYSMKTKGWFLQPQFGRENSPSNLHVSLN